MPTRGTNSNSPRPDGAWRTKREKRMTHARYAVATLLLLSAPIPAVTAQGADGLRRPSMAAASRAEAAQMSARLSNPALFSALRDSTIAAIAIGYSADSKTAEQAQEGDGHRGWEARGETYIRLAEGMAAWGAARYESGTLRNVLMNETSDYEEIRPMSLIDTVGGSKESESYAFVCGFAWEGRRAGVGIQIDYSSKSQYRTRDPRPKVDAVDARVRLGGTLRLGESQKVGLFATLRKYSQDINIKFFNAYQATMTIFQSQGLGTDYSRFTGVYDMATFKSRTLGGGATYHGLIGLVVEYGRRHVEKELADLQNAVIGETTTHRLAATLSRSGALGGFMTTAALSADMERLSLTQTVYDDGTRNYHKIAERSPYNSSKSSLRLSLLACNAADTHTRGVSLRADLGVERNEEENTDARRRLRKGTCHAHLRATAWHDMKSVRLSYGLGVSNRTALSTLRELGSPLATEQPRALEIIGRDFDRQTTSRTGGDIGIRIDIDMPRHLRTLFVAANGSGLWYAGKFGNAWGVGITAGMTL